SDTRGESNVTGTGVSSFSSGGLNLISGIVVTGAIGVTGTAGTNGVTVGKLSGAAGSKDEDIEELSRAVGATSFCSTCSSPTGTAGILPKGAAGTLNFTSETCG